MKCQIVVLFPQVTEDFHKREESTAAYDKINKENKQDNKYDYDQGHGPENE